MNSGCCQNPGPTYQCQNQVVNRCNVVEIPHYINYHTQIVNNCIRRHINVPTYSQSEEVRYIDEYVNGPMNYNTYMNNPNPGVFEEAQSSNSNINMNQTTNMNTNMNPNGFNPYNF